MATILCLGVPARAMVGIDLNSWAVGERFQGIRGIPPGPHYLYQAAPDRHSGGGGGGGADTAISSGRFLYLDHDDVWVCQWDHESEQLAPLSDSDQAARYRDGVRRHDFDAHLGPYPPATIDDWRGLSAFITKACLERLTPIGSVIRPTQAPGGEITDSVTPPPSYYTDLTESVTSRSDPAQVTAEHLDRSRQLERLVAARFDGQYDGVLGEFQFAFVAFLLGQSFDGFEQWKRLVLLLCNCEDAMCDRRIFFDQWISAFWSQLRLAPSDFFESELTSNNFLYRCLTDLFELGQETCLADKLDRFRAEAERQFHWRFGGAQLNASGRFDSDDEDAPVIVQLGFNF